MSYVLASYAFVGVLAVFDGVEADDFGTLSFWMPIALAPFFVIHLTLFGLGVAITVGVAGLMLMRLALLIGLWAVSFWLLRRARGHICRVIHRLAGCDAKHLE